MRLRQSEIAKRFGVELQATRFQDRDFSLTQVVIPRKHKTLEQLKRSRAAADRKPPRPSNESGIQFRFTLCETDYGVHIKRLFLEKSFSRLRTRQGAVPLLRRE